MPANPTQLANLFRATRSSSIAPARPQSESHARALAAKRHYVDLGGLFHWTRRQLKLDRQFKRADWTAVLGAGCAPGHQHVMRARRPTGLPYRVGADSRRREGF